MIRELVQLQAEEHEDTTTYAIGERNGQGSPERKGDMPATPTEGIDRVPTVTIAARY